MPQSLDPKSYVPWRDRVNKETQVLSDRAYRQERRRVFIEWCVGHVPQILVTVLIVALWAVLAAGGRGAQSIVPPGQESPTPVPEAVATVRMGTANSGRPQSTMGCSAPAVFRLSGDYLRKEAHAEGLGIGAKGEPVSADPDALTLEWRQVEHVRRLLIVELTKCGEWKAGAR